MRPMVIMMLSLLLASSPMVANWVSTHFKLEANYNPMMHENYWKYQGVCFMLNLIYFMMNFLFLWVAMIDASKRNLMMLRMSQALEYQFQFKDEITIRLPIFNFIDPQSIVTWIEIRRLIVETGERF